MYDIAPCVAFLNFPHFISKKPPARTMSSTTTTEPPKKQTFDLNKTMKRALGGGLAGASVFVYVKSVT